MTPQNELEFWDLFIKAIAVLQLPGWEEDYIHALYEWKHAYSAIGTWGNT